MKRHYSLIGLTLCGIGSLYGQEKPNFLIIQCDQLTQRVVGAYGETKGYTNAIDKIASEGVVFNNSYVGCPLSQPSRSALWSGLMPHQTTARSNSAEPINQLLDEEIPTLGTLFTGAGYNAVHFGKRHDMGSLRGFKHKDPVPEKYSDPEFPLNHDSFKDIGTLKDVVSFLKEEHNQPFICIADFQNPHNICGFVGENKGVHKNRAISDSLPQLPDNFEVEDWENLPIPIQYLCCSHRRLGQAAHWSNEDYRYYIAAYRHYTKIVSKQIESILSTLENTPEGENTIIVFLSDHGDGMSTHRVVTKQTCFYDEVTKVPFIFAGKGIKKSDKKVNHLVQVTTDLLPTLCDLAEISIPKDKKGISWAPLLRGDKQKEKHNYVASEWHSEYEVIVSPGRMIRTPQYKYTHYLEGDGEELYDMINDPGEKRNLAKDANYKKVLRQHRKLLKKQIKKTNDDYFSLKVKVDPKFRKHQLGYPNHTGRGARFK